MKITKNLKKWIYLKLYYYYGMKAESLVDNHGAMLVSDTEKYRKYSRLKQKYWKRHHDVGRPYQFIRGFELWGNSEILKKISWFISY